LDSGVLIQIFLNILKLNTMLLKHFGVKNE